MILSLYLVSIVWLWFVLLWFSLCSSCLEFSELVLSVGRSVISFQKFSSSIYSATFSPFFLVFQFKWILNNFMVSTCLSQSVLYYLFICLFFPLWFILSNFYWLIFDFIDHFFWLVHCTVNPIQWIILDTLFFHSRMYL